MECVSEFMFLISKIQKQTNKQKRMQKAKETTEEKRFSVENLTGYDDIVCEFILCNFNLPDQIFNFSLLIE